MAADQEPRDGYLYPSPPGAPLGSLGVEKSALMPRGMMGLKHRGRLVGVYPIGAPVEDAVYDTIILGPEDHVELMRLPGEQR